MRGNNRGIGAYIEGIKILFIPRHVYVVCLTGYLYYNSLITDFFSVDEVLPLLPNSNNEQFPQIVN